MLSKTAQPDQEETSLFLYIEAGKILQHLFIGLPIKMLLNARFQNRSIEQYHRFDALVIRRMISKTLPTLQ
jgi:hypothetical protein